MIFSKIHNRLLVTSLFVYYTFIIYHCMNLTFDNLLMQILLLSDSLIYELCVNDYIK